DFSLLQGRDPRRLIGNAQQLDAVEVHYFSAGETIWWLGTGNIVWVAGKDRLGVRAPLVLQENEGPGADNFGHRCVRIQASQPRRHHNGYLMAGLAERLDD